MSLTSILRHLNFVMWVIMRLKVNKEPSTRGFFIYSTFLILLF
ncbi:hypothetical protein [Enterococcus phage vB_Efm3_KEN18]